MTPMRRIRLLLLIVTIAVAVPARGQDLFISNATVLTVTNGTIENGDVLVRNGKIAEVGVDLRAPRGIPTIDASGMYLMPGIIDAHSHIALSSINEWTAPATPEVSVGDVLDPYAITLYRALAGGVTVSHVMHGSANVIGGQNETIKHQDRKSTRLNSSHVKISYA